MDSDIIDRIYECSVVPENWPAVLDDLARATDSHGGLLFSARKALNWTASDTVREAFDEYVHTGWFGKCSRRVCLMSQDAPSFFVEHDFWSNEELDDNPIYRDFFRPRGLGWSAGTSIQLPTDDDIVFSIERQFEQGPIESEMVERLNSLRPHLARSAMISARLQLKRAQGGGEALAALQLPALLVDAHGKVVDASPMAGEFADLIVVDAYDKLRLGDRAANELLTKAIRTLDSDEGSEVRSIPVRDETTVPMLIVHVVPIRRSAHDVFADSFALLLFTPVASERRPSHPLMKSLFDLTPGEARIASGLAAGRTLEDLAEEGEVAMTTVRSQLRRVLEKTGCTRQAEVAALLARISATDPAASG